VPLILYYHPLASFCHKVLVALFENGTPFEARFVDLADAADGAMLRAAWPVGKIPVLRDGDRVVPETSIIIEYLDRHHPGPTPLLPRDPGLALEARLMDRFFDLYVSVPMQTIVGDRLRPAGQKDPTGVAAAEDTLRTAYALAEQRLAGRTWAAGEAFGLADCSAAPALFYAGMLVPFAPAHPRLAAYFERLVERPSFARVLVEARPYLDNFPFRERIPARFRGA
jgi:glutathione S-transferase